MTGKLFLVSTPIGNPNDLTFRAIQTLQQVDIIVAESPPHTALLLKLYKIHTKLTSYHQPDLKVKTKVLLDRMQGGEAVAFVCDEGTPLVCDPGQYLVNQAIRSGIPVIPIPGTSALLTALVASGFSAESFAFHGLFPTSGKPRTRVLHALATEVRTHLFFVPANRLLATLQSIEKSVGNIDLMVGLNLTCRDESIIRGKIDAVLQEIRRKSPKGNVTIVTKGGSKRHMKPQRNKIAGSP